MLTTAAFVASSANALSLVFGVKVATVEASWGADLTLPQEENVVASLQYDGDYTGRMLLILRDGDVRRVVDLVLGRYAIRTPVKDQEVLAEMINIYAASLVTDLLGHGVTQDITPPDATVLRRAQPAEGDEVLTVQMKSEQGVVFTFCYFIHARKDQNV